MSRVETPTRSGVDLWVLGAAVALIAVAAVVGRVLLANGVDIFLGWPPLLATWAPHVGPGSVAAVLIAVLVTGWGPALAARASWARLLWGSWAAAAAWTFALAMVDGWARGVAGRLATDDEYLHDIGRADTLGSIAEVLRVFDGHILTPAVAPEQTWAWTTHVGAHPPGAFLSFLLLDRIGLGGGGAAGIAVIVVGASAAPAIAVTLRALGTEDWARRALPFLVLTPAAVWVGVSADGMFAAVAAWGVALVAVAAGSGTRTALPGVAGGLLLGVALHLSYGLALAGLLPLAVLLVTRRWSVLLPTAAGVGAVVACFTAGGFWWFDGLAATRIIYAASIAETRPYAYFVWANLAALALAVGPAVIAAGRRIRVLPTAAAALVLAAAGAILLADLSGLSKAEVERIWLPFAVWLPIACGALPHPRRWLAAQAVLALGLNHLLWTVW